MDKNLRKSVDEMTGYRLYTFEGFIVVVALFVAASVAMCGDVSRANPNIPPVIQWEVQPPSQRLSPPPAEIQPTVDHLFVWKTLPLPEPDEEVTPILPTRLGVLLEAPPTEAERIEVETQIEKCSRSVRRVADPWMVLALYRLEADLGVPDSVRGILGAVWCWESAMRDTPRSGDVGMSHGRFQMQNWFWVQCGLPVSYDVMYNLTVSATCYWSMVEKSLNDGKCPGNIVRAEAMAANGRKYSKLGCNAKSLHAVELARWRKR